MIGKKKKPVAFTTASEVLRRLEDLKQALEDELRRRQQQGQQGQQGGGKQALIPPIAELRMFRTIQTNINAQIRKFLTSHPRVRRLDEGMRAYIERLAHAQGRLKDLWEDFIRNLGVR